MFGTYRLTLALFVILTHIGGIEVIAGIGVWGFFMLSGYLITGVLNTRYGFKASQREWFKRWDDIMGHMSYPVYLTHFACTYAVVLLGQSFKIRETFAVLNKDGLYDYTHIGSLAVIALCFSFSFIVARFVEEPMDNIRHRAAKAMMKRLGKSP